MSGFYKYLESIMPVKKILMSLTVGTVSLLIVLISGLTSDFVTPQAVASRTFSAFSFTALSCFIFFMCCEEYAIFKTKRELENFIDDAAVEDVENFDRKEYLHEDEDENSGNEISTAEVSQEIHEAQDDSFRPMDFRTV